MRLQLFLKRFLDALFSVLLLILLSPLFAVIAVAIKLDSAGPVIFKQDRIGKDGKIFKMYKFRSMVVNAEKTGAGLFNYKGDPRVTKTGEFLRRTSLDELPQLVNILKGELSFVGPRPPVTYELGDFSLLNRKFRRRFDVKPGITGFAQVQGRNELPWNIKVEYDNQYIDKFAKYGVLFDFAIIFETFKSVLAQKNIYEERPENAQDDVAAALIAEQEVIRMAQEPLPDEEEITATV